MAKLDLNLTDKQRELLKHIIKSGNFAYTRKRKMTKEEAEIVLLKHALQEAQHCVGFLHGCLTDSNYKYAYPEHTIKNLKEWSKLSPISELVCYHSMMADDCPSCISNKKRHLEHLEALKVLGKEY
jgi:hypothetical protein